MHPSIVTNMYVSQQDGGLDAGEGFPLYDIQWTARFFLGKLKGI
jgi:hypothetical protein